MIVCLLYLLLTDCLILQNVKKIIIFVFILINNSIGLLVLDINLIIEFLILLYIQIFDLSFIINIFTLIVFLYLFHQNFSFFLIYFDQIVEAIGDLIEELQLRRNKIYLLHMTQKHIILCFYFFGLLINGRTVH